MWGLEIKLTPFCIHFDGKQASSSSQTMVRQRIPKDNIYSLGAVQWSLWPLLLSPDIDRWCFSHLYKMEYAVGMKHEWWREERSHGSVRPLEKIKARSLLPSSFPFCSSLICKNVHYLLLIVRNLHSGFHCRSANVYNYVLCSLQLL